MDICKTRLCAGTLSIAPLLPRVSLLLLALSQWRLWRTSGPQRVRWASGWGTVGHLEFITALVAGEGQ